MILIRKTNYRDVDRTETYGWVFRSAVSTAGKRLSYDAFKVYIDLSLNQDNYHCKDVISDAVADELYRYGYLSFSRGETTFNEWGKDPVASSQPELRQTTQPVQAPYSPKYPCPGTTAQENKILDIAIDQAYPAQGTCGINPGNVAMLVYDNAEMGEYCRQVIVDHIDFWTKHAMERLGPQQKEPPHSEPMASYKNLGYDSDMLVHVGADGRVQEDDRQYPPVEVNEPEYENSDVPW